MTAEIAALEEQLQQAIEAEQFEEAASIRDQLQECRRIAADEQENRDL